MRKKGYIKIILILNLIVLMLVGCAKEAPVSNVKPKKEEMIVATTSIPDSLSSSTNLDKREEDIICMLFEGLVEVTANADVAPSIATGWKISPDGLQYNFLIDENYFWSNGEKIVANDFLEYFSHIFSPSNKNYSSEELYSIYGLEDYKKGIKSFDEVGIYAHENNELIIRLVREDKNLLKNLSKPAYRLRDTDDNLDAYKENFQEIKYTGAYEIVSASDTNLKLSKNKEFSADMLGANNIDLFVSGDSIKDFAMYNTGKIDMVTNPPITAFSEGNLIQNINSAQTSNLSYLVFNCTDGIGQYLDFRKALYLHLNNSLFNSYMSKNELATVDCREISSDEIEENVFYKREFKQEYSETEKLKNEKIIKEFLESIPNVLSMKIKVVALDNFENRKLMEFLSAEFKTLGLVLDARLYTQDELNDVLEKAKFDIFIDSVNLRNENIKERTSKISEKYLGNEFSAISLYSKNDYWCKSSNIKNLYVDGNGNVSYKKSIYKPN